MVRSKKILFRVFSEFGADGAAMRGFLPFATSVMWFVSFFFSFSFSRVNAGVERGGVVKHGRGGGDSRGCARGVVVGDSGGGGGDG